MREKQKSCFKNYVLLVGKYFIFIYLFIFLHKHYYIGAKLILAILMLISRKPVQRGGIGEKCGVFLRYSAPAIAKGLGSLMLRLWELLCQFARSF